ncbi:MAG: proprotein convertase P-domain-containing protein, partial [Saprospiraceae bacterium]|nr:proprotein convertase P-domain-containing protein [Saprospiraceae bacterium]
ALEYQGGGTGNTCNDYVATDVPKDIPDNMPSGVNSIINVTSGGTITDVNVKSIKGTHSYLGALSFKIISPTGTMVTLINGACDNGNNTTDFDISLDDEAGTATIPCPYNTGATVKPQNPLSAFDGENPMGNWILKVADNDGFDDTGKLIGWTLEICTSGGGGPCPPTLAVNDANIASGVYQAGTQLTSAGMIGQGNTVTFRAGNNVEMQNNFTVPQTSIFEARIGGCQ